jgi:hypothetical protein
MYVGTNTEKTIGYATDLQYTVNNGQKMIFTVDSPFPAEIAQAAGPTYVRGSMSLFLPKSSTPESLGLVPYRTSAESGGAALHAASTYFHLKIYDRESKGTIFSLDYCKVGSYSMQIAAKQVVKFSISFEAMYGTVGNVTAGSTR